MFEKVKELALNEEGFIIQSLNTFIVVAVMISVTVFVVYQIGVSMPLITSGAYNTTQVYVNTGIANALNIAPIILILLVISVVIGVVMMFTNFGRGGGAQ